MVEITLNPSDLLVECADGFEVTITRKLREIPTISSIEIFVKPQDLPTFLAGLEKGETISALNITWVIADISLQKLYDYGSLYRATIQLQNVHESLDTEIKSKVNYLDQPRFLKPLLSSGNLHLKDLFPYQGQDFTIPYDPGSVDSKTVIKARDFLKYEYLLNASGLAFIFYGDTEIEFRVWGMTSTHELTKILNDEIEIRLPGQGAMVDGVQLVEECVNRRFVEDSNILADNGYDIREVVVENNMAYSPSDIITPEIVASTSGTGWAYDNGGTTKTRTVTTYLNGTKVKERRQTYGFVGSSIGFHTRPSSFNTSTFLSTHQISTKVVDGETVREITRRPMSGFLLAQCWQMVEDVTETHHFNKRTGYLDRVTTSGWKLRRFKQESDSFECLQVEIDYLNYRDEFNEWKSRYTSPASSEERIKREEELAKLKDKINKIRNIFAGFFTVNLDPLSNREVYHQESMALKYQDLEATPENPHHYVREEISQRDWIRQVIDPDFDPRFTDNPEDIRYLSVGERYNKTVRIKILAPQNRQDSSGREIFEVITKETNAQDDNFKNRIELSPTETFLKRPSEHQRLITYGRLSPPIEHNAEPEDFLLNTPGTGYEKGDPVLGDWSSPGVVNKSMAVAVMEHEYSILNTQAAKTTKVRIPADLSIQEGDIIRFEGEIWIVLSISTVFVLREGIPAKAVADTQELELGRGVFFGETWQYHYPDEQSYPPGITYPGFENPPQGQVIKVLPRVSVVPEFAEIEVSSSLTPIVVQPVSTIPAIFEVSIGTLTPRIPNALAVLNYESNITTEIVLPPDIGIQPTLLEYESNITTQIVEELGSGDVVELNYESNITTQILSELDTIEPVTLNYESGVNTVIIDELSRIDTISLEFESNITTEILED